MIWPYHIRLLNERGQPVSCASHPGPLEQALLSAQRLLEKSQHKHAEVCSVLRTNLGTGTGPRIELVTQYELLVNILDRKESVGG